jgi:hypothetical protein
MGPIPLSLPARFNLEQDHEHRGVLHRLSRVYLRICRLICTQISRLNLTPTLVDLPLSYWYVLQMDLFTNLLMCTHQFYDTVLKLVFQETHVVPIPGRLVRDGIPVSLPLSCATTTGVPLSLQCQGRPSSWSRDFTNNTVPDWTRIPSIPNDRSKDRCTSSHRNRGVIGQPSEIGSLRDLVKSQWSTATFRNSFQRVHQIGTPGDVYSTQIPIANMQLPRRKPTPHPVLHFLYDTKPRARRLHQRSTRDLTLRPMWKLSLYRVDQVLSRRGWELDPSFGSVEQANIETPVDSGSWVTRKKSTQQSGLILQNLYLYPGFDLETKDQFPSPLNPHTFTLKAPVKVYKYEPLVQIPGAVSRSSIGYRTRKDFPCLLEAASRQWVHTIQNNPFGKITLFVK